MSEDRECRGSGEAQRETQAPELSYLPREPRAYSPGIGLIGCGGIAPYHLGAYAAAGYRVTALCDVDEARATKLRDEHFPGAAVSTDYRTVLDRDDIEVADIAVHPEHRTPITEAAFKAGKHVLSQKPFVVDLDEGEALVALAERLGRKLAVNQNGRWAPHFSYMREAVRRGVVGEVCAAHLSTHWSHDWTADTPFNEVRHLILYDFGIHWFDILGCFFAGRPAKRVRATTAHAPGQRAKPDMLAQATVEYESGQASLVFDGFTTFGACARGIIVGTEGTIACEGPNINEQQVTLWTAEGYARPALDGSWFTTGFHGTMAELLCAIEEEREPFNGARENLNSLALCFAAAASADTGEPEVPGAVRRMPGTE